MAETSSGNPYIEDGEERTFSVEHAEEEFVWHRDREKRRVTVLEGEGWQFQYDESIPMLLKKEQMFVIPQMMYHRLIKGKTDLVLKIETMNWDK